MYRIYLHVELGFLVYMDTHMYMYKYRILTGFYTISKWMWIGKVQPFNTIRIE